MLVVVGTLGLLSMAIGPTRRQHTSCNADTGCGPDPNGPRMLEVTTPTWSDSTEFPDGPRSWEVSFADAPTFGSPAQYQSADVYNDSQIGYKWAGDATSSLVMMRRPTTEVYSIEGYSGSGLTGAQHTKTVGPPDYAEMDWAGITGVTGTDPMALFASFTTRWWVTSNNAWPWAIGGVPPAGPVFSSPYFRLYDHGICGIELPWEGTTSTGMEGIGPRIRQSSGSLGPGYKIEHVVFDFGVAAVSGTGTILDSKVDAYPRLGRGPEAPSDQTTGSFPGVYQLDDSIFTIGKVHFDIQADVTIFPVTYEGIGCGGQAKIMADRSFMVKPGAAFPSRILPAHRQTDQIDIDISDSGCKLLGYLPLVPLGTVKDEIKKAIRTLLSTADGQMGWQLNSAITPVLPSLFELKHWLFDTCPNPPSPVFPCVERSVAGGKASGADDFAEWMDALRGGTTPPIHSIQADNETAEWIVEPADFPETTAKRVDREYKGCLGTDLRVKTARCGELLQEYRTFASELEDVVAPPESGPDIYADVRPRVDAFRRLAYTLSPSDLECRPLSPGLNMNGVADPTSLWSCVDASGAPDDPEDPVCDLVMKRPRYETPNSPPTGMTCEMRDERKLPRKSVSECSVLEDKCVGPFSNPDTPQCLDYFLYCGSQDEYCNPNWMTGIPAQICHDAVNEPRCFERESYCAPGDFCADGDINKYCESTEYSPDATPPPPSNGVFRTTAEVSWSVCRDKISKRCSCRTIGPTEVPDHWCGLRLPVARTNISPGGFELVMVNSPGREGNILAALDELIVSTAPSPGNDTQQIRFCDESLRGWNRAGELPALSIFHVP